MKLGLAPILGKALVGRIVEDMAGEVGWSSSLNGHKWPSQGIWNLSCRQWEGHRSFLQHKDICHRKKTLAVET